MSVTGLFDSDACAEAVGLKPSDTHRVGRPLSPRIRAPRGNRRILLDERQTIDLEALADRLLAVLSPVRGKFRAAVESTGVTAQLSSTAFTGSCRDLAVSLRADQIEQLPALGMSLDIDIIERSWQDPAMTELSTHTLSDDTLAATFVPGAGMIGVSLAHGGVELLGQRRGLQAYLAEGKTMGIPLLHPWANRLSRDDDTMAGETVAVAAEAAGVHLDGNGLPMHGLMAAQPGWRVQSATERELTAEFDFGAHPELLASFPFPHRLTLAVVLAERRLRIRATLTATSSKPVPVSFGFHPYLQLPEAPREQWQVELPARRHLVLDGSGIPTGEGSHEPAETAPLGERLFDDGYDEIAEGAVFAVSAGGRRLEVSFDEGYPCAQIFAPASEGVICFEPMTAPTNALRSGAGLRLAHAGRPFTAAFSITVA